MAWIVRGGSPRGAGWFSPQTDTIPETPIVTTTVTGKRIRIQQEQNKIQLHLQKNSIRIPLDLDC